VAILLQEPTYFTWLIIRPVARTHQKFRVFIDYRVINMTSQVYTINVNGKLVRGVDAHTASIGLTPPENNWADESSLQLAGQQLTVAPTNILNIQKKLKEDEKRVTGPAIPKATPAQAMVAGFNY
jgi:hypothetical protein